jgi:DNA ligase (NAD+)
LENTYNAEDIKERNQRIVKIVKDVKNVNNEISYRIEPKFDGLSVELVYEKGKLVQAITRGDGLVGDDITSNVKTIKSIPHTLKMPIDIGVRGEIMMPKSVRKDINKEREENGETPFANTRNAAAGSIKLLDSGEVARRKLVCFVYDVLRHGERETDNGTRE